MPVWKPESPTAIQKLDIQMTRKQGVIRLMNFRGEPLPPGSLPTELRAVLDRHWEPTLGAWIVEKPHLVLVLHALATHLAV